MPATWERGKITSEYTMVPGELVVYTSEQAPGYRIESWEPGVWAVMLLREARTPVLGFTRPTLTAAKRSVQEELDEVPTDQRKRF